MTTEAAGVIPSDLSRRSSSSGQANQSGQMQGHEFHPLSYERIQEIADRQEAMKKAHRCVMGIFATTGTLFLGAIASSAICSYNNTPSCRKVTNTLFYSSFTILMGFALTATVAVTSQKIEAAMARRRTGTTVQPENND